MEKGGVANAEYAYPNNLQAYMLSRADQQQLELVSAYLISKPFSLICTAPLARITILFQVQGMYSNYGAMTKPNLFREFSRIVKEEGFRGFWKGNLVNIARRPPTLAIQMLTNLCLANGLQSVFGSDQMSNTTKDVVTCTTTLMSSIVATSATYPMNLVRTRLAAQKSGMHYNGIWHAFSTIYKEEGFLGLYKGNGASVLRKAPKQAIRFSSCGLLTSLWESRRPDDSIFVSTIGSIGLGGFISSISTFPIDVVRRRLQVDGAGGQARIYNTGLFGTLKHIVKMEGLQGLYRGVLPDFLKEFPRVGIYFMAYQMLKRSNVFSGMYGVKEVVENE